MPDFGLSSSSGFLWCVIVILGRAAFLFCQTSYGVWGFIVCHLDDVGGCVCLWEDVEEDMVMLEIVHWAVRTCGMMCVVSRGPVGRGVQMG